MNDIAIDALQAQINALLEHTKVVAAENRKLMIDSGAHRIALTTLRNVLRQGSPELFEAYTAGLREGQEAARNNNLPDIADEIGKLIEYTP